MTRLTSVIRMLWLSELTLRDWMNVGLECQRQKCGQWTASLDRHAQLTLCFFAEAELLIWWWCFNMFVLCVSVSENKVTANDFEQSWAKEVCTNFRGCLLQEATNRSGAVKIFHLVISQISWGVWPFVIYIIMKALNGFLTTKTDGQMTLKDVCGYIMLENFIGHVCRKCSVHCQPR